MQHPHHLAALVFLSIIPSLMPGCDCQQSQLLELEAQAALDDSLIDFGEVPVGAHLTLFRELKNSGNAALEINDLSFSYNTGTFRADLQPNPVPALQSAQLSVDFSPLLAQQWEDQLNISSSNPDIQISPIAVRGLGVPPLIHVSPTSIDYGAVDLHDSERRYVNIDNPQDFAQSLHISLQGDDAEQFNVRVDPGPISVAASGHMRLAVEYAPQYGGEHQAKLHIDYCGEGCGAIVDLSGQCERPRLSVSPLQLDFGSVGPQEQKALDLILRNTGFGPLSISDIQVDLGQPIFSLNNPPSLPIVLESQQSLSVQVNFSPMTSGEQQGRVLIRSDDPTSPQGFVEMRGQQSGAEIKIVPEIMDFGLVDDGEIRSAQILLVNNGNAPVLITDSFLQQSDAAFSLPAPLVLPFWLEAQSNVSLPIDFAAANEGQFFAELVILADIEGGRQFTARLSGTRSNARACVLTSQDEALHFGNILLGSASLQRIQLSNLGSGHCHISLVDFSPVHVNDPAFSIRMPSQLDLGPGEQTNAPVVFRPEQAGVAKAVALVRSRVGESPDLLIGLGGIGARSGLVAAPPLLDFGTVATNCSTTTLGLAISNVGQIPFAVNPALLDASSSADFTISSGSIIGTLEPGTSHLLYVTFSPRHDGLHSGLIHITADQYSGGVVVPLMALAVGANLLSGDEHFEVEPSNTVDVLFVIDNSGSMTDNQANLADNFHDFIQGADILGNQADFQIGIVTTDVDDSSQSGILQGRPKILLPSNSNIEQTFSNSVQVGANGSAWEQGLQAAYLALSPPLIDNSVYNLGFLRSEAALAIIFVSDEDDNSMQNAVAFYVNYFKGLKALTGKPVLINGVTGGAQGCTDASGNMSIPAPRYDQAILATGGMWMSICDNDWSTGLESLGQAVFNVSNRFQLSGQPEVASLEVRVNGVLLNSSDWSYDSNSNTVFIDPERTTLNPGDDVGISYHYSC